MGGRGSRAGLGRWEHRSERASGEGRSTVHCQIPRYKTDFEKKKAERARELCRRGSQKNGVRGDDPMLRHSAKLRQASTTNSTHAKTFTEMGVRKSYSTCSSIFYKTRRLGYMSALDFKYATIRRGRARQLLADVNITFPRDRLSMLLRCSPKTIFSPCHLPLNLAE